MDWHMYLLGLFSLTTAAALGAGLYEARIVVPRSRGADIQTAPWPMMWVAVSGAASPPDP